MYYKLHLLSFGTFGIMLFVFLGSMKTVDLPVAIIGSTKLTFIA